MSRIMQFLEQNQHGTGVEAPIADGLNAISGANQCQCDCYECAGGHC